PQPRLTSWAVTLAATGFTIHATIAGAGGSLIEVASAGGGQHGYYLLDVVPVTYQGTQYTLAYGRYIFALAVAPAPTRARPSARYSCIEPLSRMTHCRPEAHPRLPLVAERGRCPRC